MGIAGWVGRHEFKSVYSTLFLDYLKPGKFQYTSIILLIINNIYRSQCTNSVLWEKVAASRSK